MRPRHAVMLALLSAVWGASYLLIAEAIEEIPESLVVLGRTGLAALALLALIVARGGEAARLLADIRRRPGDALLLGAVAIAIPFVLITFGERTVPSGLAAVLVASAPIFIAILAPFLDRSEIMSPAQWTGLMVGIAGVALLVGVEQIGSAGELLGALAMIGAAASYGLSGFILKRRYHGYPPIVTTFFSVAAAAVLVLPAAAAQPPDGAPGPVAVLAVVALALVGTAWAFVVYFRLIAEIGVGRASVVAYTIPPVALAYGWALRDEAITPGTVAGMVLILAGVFLVARGGARPAPRAAAPLSWRAGWRSRATPPGRP
ncbi:MAG TPA: DMT family transporter [Miltoncostaeaceae bacterium]|nr:DMT family transporter [Miltoncostaeaceae bacterium]